MFGHEASMARDGAGNGNRELWGGMRPIIVSTGVPLAASPCGVRAHVRP